MRQLQLAYSRKEKVARLMSNLDMLRDQSGVSEEDYSALKDEYESFLGDAEEAIDKLRIETEEQIERHEENLKVLEGDRQRLEVRLKVGEMSQEKFSREVGRVDRQIMNAQNDIARLRKSLEANSSAELGGFVDVPIEHDSQKNGGIDLERVSESAGRVVERVSNRFSAEGGIRLVLPDEWQISPQWIVLGAAALLMLICTLLPWEYGIGRTVRGIAAAGGLGVIAFLTSVLACGTLFLGLEYARSIIGLLLGGLALVVGFLALIVGPGRTGALWLFVIASVTFTIIHYRYFADLRDHDGPEL
jgi:hypothetical protein